MENLSQKMRKKKYQKILRERLIFIEIALAKYLKVRAKLLKPKKYQKNLVIIIIKFYRKKHKIMLAKDIIMKVIKINGKIHYCDH